MSYAIIRNQKYKSANLKGIFRHNERKNKNYSNENIDKAKSHLNYAIKSSQYSYEKEFEKIRKKYDLKGQIKTISNIACEYIITSDKKFFENIGEQETKRYFETAYQFVIGYKDLGEQYILSANVHLDEETPHLHLVFLPIIHTKDKNGNDIDKLACSEFWKAKDSYRQLQNAFYQYMIDHHFELERGLSKEETNRKHQTVKEFKEITNFEKTKETLKNIKLELPDVPDIAGIGKFSLKRDEKILEEIIKPKDDIIKNLYQDNLDLHRELSKQTKIIEEAEKYQQERDKIIDDNKKLNKETQKLKQEYQEKSNTLDFEFEKTKKDLEYEYKYKFHKLEHENKQLHKIIDKFKETISKFIKWVCRKFDLPSEDEIIRDFEKETRIFINPGKQIKKEEREKDFEKDF